MKYTEVVGPFWSNKERTLIDCTVTFDHIGEPVPFTACATDCTEHGREIFARAAAGDFGPVADYVAPPAPPEPVQQAQDTTTPSQ